MRMLAINTSIICVNQFKHSQLSNLFDNATILNTYEVRQLTKFSLSSIINQRYNFFCQKLPYIERSEKQIVGIIRALNVQTPKMFNDELLDFDYIVVMENGSLALLDTIDVALPLTRCVRLFWIAGS